MSEIHRILIVEDEMVISMELSATLKRLGYGIAGQAIRGEEAITKAGELNPDLILMDIRLQGDMDGIEAAERIQRLYDIPVVFLTAHSDDPTLHRAITVQPSGYLIKPFHDRELYSTIELSLYKHDIRRRIRPLPLIEAGFDGISPDIPCLLVSHTFMIRAATPAAAELLETNPVDLVATKLESWIVSPSKKGIIDSASIVFKTQNGNTHPALIQLGLMTDEMGSISGFLLFFLRGNTSG